MYSSLIEGSSIDIEKYIEYKATGDNSTDMIQIQDLILAYQFAKTHALTKDNLLKAHSILSTHFNISTKYKGNVRDKEVTIGNFFITVYEGAKVAIVAKEFEQLANEITDVRKKKVNL